MVAIGRSPVPPGPSVVVPRTGPLEGAAPLLARQGLLPLPLHGGLLVVRPPLHLLEGAVLLHLLLERLQGLLDLVVDDRDLHAGAPARPISDPAGGRWCATGARAPSGP